MAGFMLSLASRALLLRYLRELVGEGVDDELKTIGDAELRIDRAEMMCDCRGADEESLRNLTVF